MVNSAQGPAAAISPPLRSELSTALRSCRAAFVGTGVISGLINVLMLTGSFYMLEVYDRVLPSRSIPTLVGLTVLTRRPVCLSSRPRSDPRAPFGADRSVAR
jgi:ATP-binding cassette subfamily C protein